MPTFKKNDLVRRRVTPTTGTPFVVVATQDGWVWVRLLNAVEENAGLVFREERLMPAPPLTWEVGTTYRRIGDEELLTAVYVHPDGAVLLVRKSSPSLRLTYSYAGPGDRDAFIEEVL